MANAQKTVPRPPELHVKPRSYQPTQAELEAVLLLRSVHMSDRLPRFWANFARGYRKEVNLCA